MLPTQYINFSSGIEHQLNSNWCTNHAVSSLLEAQSAMKYNEIVELSNSWGMMLSKKVDKKPYATATPLDVLMKEVSKFGMCTELLYPTWHDENYNDNIFLDINTNMLDIAMKYRPEEVVKIDTKDIQSIKESIVFNGGCVLTVSLYNEHNMNYNGFIDKPKKGSEPKGVHAIYLCGYIEGLEQTINGKTYEDWFVLQESYGKNRGFDGYLFVPYEAFSEAWTGLYTVDKYIRECYTFKNENYKYQDYHKNNKINFPRNKVVLDLSKNCMYVNGKKEKCFVKVLSGNTLVPFKQLCNALGYSVRYDSENKSIYAYNKNRNQNITMKVGSNIIKSQQSGITHEIISNTNVQIIDGYTMIPLRSFCDITKSKTYYNSSNKTIEIDSMV